jgi:hypothetical protein
MRRSGKALEAEITEALVEALCAVGMSARLEAGGQEGGRPDLILNLGNRTVVVVIKSVVSEGDAPTIVAQLRHYGSGLKMVAAERIAEGAKECFIKAGIGFFDRRGRVRLVGPDGLFVDALTQPGATITSPSAPLSGEVAKEVAIVLLSDPLHPPGVRPLAGMIGRAPSSVLEALRGLRQAGLVSSANEPLIPDLFWDLESQWHREVHPLAAAPEPAQRRRTDPLQLGLGSGNADGWLLDEEGWALTDTLGAAAWGMPLVASSSYPPDFYVPSAVVLRRAIATLGKATEPEERACTVSTAPVQLVCRRRVSRPSSTWPVADHVVVALDLARDRARGREVLDRWRPEGIIRVW